MARPLLPPRGVVIPTQMIYHPQLPPAVVLTWIQLRGLAWDGTHTPPLSMQELVALTGKRQATIYGHMSQLRDIAALSWVATGQGKIIVSFAENHRIYLKTTAYDRPLRAPRFQIPRIWNCPILSLLPLFLFLILV